MRNVFFLVFISTISLFAKIVKVPADFSTIQSAINASSNGDTVVVYPGTYFENIIYRGKNIVVTSRYFENQDINYIASTIINGSKPKFQDTASVVLFINHEDSTAVIQGFTITGGKGTAWPDEHSAGTFIEGGGIISALASPRIMYNVIINNDATTSRTGIVSAGGGGIRVGDGNPYIANNIIMNNKGKYGAGVVANFTGVIIRNNIIVGNVGGGDYGGGGVWLNGSGLKPKFLENNTIIGNQSYSDGGGLLLYDATATATLRNNIIWGNNGVSAPQMSLREGAVVDAKFNDIQNGNVGSSNLNVAPMFADSMLYLLPNSPLIDAGDSSAFYEDKNVSGTAVFPSRGTKRNDIGAYGGQYAAILPLVSSARLGVLPAQINFGKIRPDSVSSVTLKLYNNGTISLHIDSIRFNVNVPKNLTVSKTGSNNIIVALNDSVVLQWNPSAAQNLTDALLIYHNDTSQARPLSIPLSGKAIAIEKIAKGVMYSGSGTTDTAKIYSIDTSKALANLIGKSGYSQIVSLRTNPKTQELIALINSTTPQLVRMSSTNAESFPLPQLALTNPKGMVFKSDGTLLIGTFTGAIYTVDMNTGAVASFGSNGLRYSGLAFNPANGTLWMSVRPTSSGKDNIYKVNPVTMQATLVGTTGFGISTKDITFDAQGRLFGVLDTTGSQSYLIQIDTANGKGKLIGGLTVKGIETIELQSNEITNVPQLGKNIPLEFSLAQNYPNPFNPSTTIKFSIQSPGFVSLKVYDILGKEVATLVNEQLVIGKYESKFNAEKLSSGIYYYTFRAGDFVSTKKMLLIK